MNNPDILPQHRVVVLLAAYNGEHWLDEQVQSILKQQDVDVHLHISVDAGRDNTQQMCEAYAVQHSNVTLLPSGRFGSAGRNFFRLLRDVQLTELDYVAFADQDDIWLLDKLKRSTEQLAEHQAGAYSSNVLAFWPDGRHEMLDKAQPQVRWDHLFEAAGPGCSYVLSPPLARALQSFVREHWHALQDVALHDWFTYAFARQAGWAWVIDCRPSLLYRQHGNNEFGANTTWRSMFGRLKRVRKGWWFEQIALITKLVGGESLPPLSDKPFGRRQFAWMFKNARQCRRRRRDQLLFAVLCAVAWCIG
ncbi:glycosyl transferase [Pseudomonas azotoformans]|uniref:Glycosyl transferase n=1 Tax=Pseudomonas azotoformans TaxID=47878 RepID=A0A1V2JJF0_PSEAZ|nr:glycosyltransferase [Pseudomonas azotoformans]OIN47896.1 glycosyl transferase [Pseudomonas azotoformans]ONH45434.1 glycosyl transferase [Pseudomonas azotoformans]SDO34703.1 rhamnosyltransferase [Pseudomonas azotoformans]